MFAAMPTWKGWSEQEVLQKPPLTDSPAAMGFTAINAPQVRTQTTPGRTPELQTGQNDALSTNSALAGNDTRYAVSEYLGFGDSNSSVAAVQALQVPGRKRVTTKGKKRAVPAFQRTKNKRRKTPDVSDSMIVSKPPGRTLQVKSTVVYDGDAAASDPKHPLNASDFPQELDSISDGVLTSENMYQRSVYKPATSMSSFHDTVHQTSVDVAKAAVGRSKTLYRRAQTENLPQAGVSFAEPWLNLQVPTSEQSGNQTSARILRPRKGANERIPASTSNISTPQEIHYRRTASKERRKVAKSKGNTQKANSARRRSSAKSEELFPCGDDDDADILALVDNVEKDAKVREHCLNAIPGYPPTAPASSIVLADPQKNTEQSPRRREASPILGPDEDFLAFIDDDDTDMVDAVDAAEEEVAPCRSPTPPARERKLNMREVSHDEDYGGALFSEVERELLEKVKSSTQNPGPKPIVRQSFPKSILDRSPIFGASNTTLLRTCFRIGEALKEGCQAVRSNKDVVLELYARVTSSRRDGRKQFFVFKDLYHDNPPHLEGVFELWQQSRLWELDSKAFLTPKEGGVMSRVIARMRRVEMKWRLEVLSIWETDWEDVDVAAGIYAKEYGSPEECA